jgi:hypothetical protein
MKNGAHLKAIRPPHQVVKKGKKTNGGVQDSKWAQQKNRVRSGAIHALDLE